MKKQNVKELVGKVLEKMGADFYQPIENTNKFCIMSKDRVTMLVVENEGYFSEMTKADEMKEEHYMGLLSGNKQHDTEIYTDEFIKLIDMATKANKYGNIELRNSGIVVSNCEPFRIEYQWETGDYGVSTYALIFINTIKPLIKKCNSLTLRWSHGPNKFDKEDDKEYAYPLCLEMGFDEGIGYGEEQKVRYIVAPRIDG